MMLTTLLGILSFGLPIHQEPEQRRDMRREAQFAALESRIDRVLSAMTLEEKVSMVHGGSSFGTKAIPRLGLPEYRFTDGPNGVRDNEGWPMTAFPPGLSMAATWDVDLVRRVGAAIGQEAKAAGKSVQLGPGVNIDRVPLCGRTFEYFSEDPHLASRMGVAWIEGLQSQGVAACVKHFATNSCEDARGTVDAQLSERTLREIYLPAFHAAITEAKSGSIMAAYNKVNGQYSAENNHLINDILKGEWGFKGFIMSDWGAVHSTVPTALNGLDLEMPGDENNYLGKPLLDAVKRGAVPESAIDDKVRRILRILLPIEVPNPKSDPHASTAADQRLAREVAEASMVLLKNSNHVLPLDAAKIKTLAVIGPNANQTYSRSGGSGSMIPPYEVTPLEGIRNFLGDKVKVVYSEGADQRPERGRPITSDHLRSAGGAPGLDGEYFANKDLSGQPAFRRVDPKIDFDWNKDKPAPGVNREYFSVRWTGFLSVPESGTYELTTNSDDGSRVWVDGKEIVDNWGDHSMQMHSGRIQLQKGRRYPIKVEFYQGFGDAAIQLLWQRLDAPDVNPWLDAAVAAAKSADAVVLCVGINHEYDSEGTDKPNMKLFPGQDELIQKVLAANPQTVVVLINGTPLEMPWLGKTPAVLESWYPGLEGGNALANVLFGKANPSGKLPLTFPKRLEDSPAIANGNYPPKNDVLKYDEGILVGYRYFDTKQIAPLFPFGYGLSYTSFSLGAPRIRPAGDGYDVDVTVKNTGRVAGAEVVQVYVSQKGAPELRPEKELKSFAKVHLAPNQSKDVKLHLDRSAFAYYSDRFQRWYVDGGSYTLRVGVGSRDIRHTANVVVGGDH